MRSRPTLGEDLGEGWARANRPSLHFTDQGCCFNSPTSIHVPVSSGKGVETHQNCPQTSPLPPLSHNDEILMLGQKLGMAINELSINPFLYSILCIYQKKTFSLYSDISIVYKRKKNNLQDHTFFKVVRQTNGLSHHLHHLRPHLLRLSSASPPEPLPPLLQHRTHNSHIWKWKSWCLTYQTTKDCKKSLWALYTYPHLPLPPVLLLHSHHHPPHPVTERYNQYTINTIAYLL